VDDDHNIRLFVSTALADDGIEILEAESGAEAIATARTEEPDLIILDMMMPDMDGKTTIGKLRQEPNLVDTPVIFLTAKVQAHEVESYSHLGAIGIISKPFDPLTLPEQVSALMEARKGAK
jgi:CheY-like chemotaxis protein